mmetsp:Transcript_9169/g.26070  ORF Transcript_9169/g.26070 Transcript_9169/m.26070 type:complete len:277 (+) Transcript_9169:775-1605(+)
MQRIASGSLRRSTRTSRRRWKRRTEDWQNPKSLCGLTRQSPTGATFSRARRTCREGWRTARAPSPQFSSLWTRTSLGFTWRPGTRPERSLGSASSSRAWDPTGRCPNSCGTVARSGTGSCPRMTRSSSFATSGSRRRSSTGKSPWPSTCSGTSRTSLAFTKRSSRTGTTCFMHSKSTKMTPTLSSSSRSSTAKRPRMSTTRRRSFLRTSSRCASPMTSRRRARSPEACPRKISRPSSPSSSRTSRGRPWSPSSKPSRRTSRDLWSSTRTSSQMTGT